jgi:hypothetical protein
MGIDNDGVIVTINKMAQEVVSKEGVKRGHLVSDYFPEEVVDLVKQGCAVGQHIDIDADYFKDRGCQAKLLPLTGAYEGRGVILTIDQLKA